MNDRNKMPPALQAHLLGPVDGRLLRKQKSLNFSNAQDKQVNLNLRKIVL
jgi:hypothetical protein